MAAIQQKETFGVGLSAPPFAPSTTKGTVNLVTVFWGFDVPIFDMCPLIERAQDCSLNVLVGFERRCVEPGVGSFEDRGDG